MVNPKNAKATKRARELRRQETKSEKLLWSILRAKQLCSLKFRKQHPIGPFFADFACSQRMLVIEIDGGYHDAVVEADLSREAHLQNLGWEVIRFTDQEVEKDAEAIGRAIASHLALKYEFKRRQATGAGMDHLNAPQNRRGNS